MDKKVRRVHYPANYKLRVIKIAEELNSNRKAASQFSIDEANVRRWRKDKHKLLPKVCEAKRKGRLGPQKGWYPEIEKKVKTFLVEQRQKGLKVSYDDIQDLGRREARAMNIPTKKFKASRGWARRFMTR